MHIFIACPFYPGRGRQIQRLESFLDLLTESGYYELHRITVAVYIVRSGGWEKPCAREKEAVAVINRYIDRCDFNAEIFHSAALDKTGAASFYGRKAVADAVVRGVDWLCFADPDGVISKKWLHYTLPALTDAVIIGRKLNLSTHLDYKGVGGVFGETEVSFPNTAAWRGMEKHRKALLMPPRLCGGFSLNLPAGGGRRRDGSQDALVMTEDVARHVPGWHCFFPLTLFADIGIPDSVAFLETLPERVARAGHILFGGLPPVKKSFLLGKKLTRYGRFAVFYHYGEACAKRDAYAASQGWERPSLREHGVSMFLPDRDVFHTADILTAAASPLPFDNIYRPRGLQGETVPPEVPVTADGAFVQAAALIAETAYGRGDTAYRPAMRSAAVAAFIAGYAGRAAGGDCATEED